MLSPRALVAVVVALIALPASASAATVTPQPDAGQLGLALFGPNNVAYGYNQGQTVFAEQPRTSSTGGSPYAPTSGSFEAPYLGFNASSTDKTVVLATGNVTDIPLYNQGSTLSYTGYYDEVENHSANANDVTTLKVALTVPAGKTCLSFDYRFLSEEFPTYVGSKYNDAFIAGIDFNDWENESAYNITRPHDIAADPAGKPVSVNGVGPTAMLPAEAQGTVLNAATGLVTTKAPITPGAHFLYFSIFDAGDKQLDSAVFIDNLQLLTESSATCKPPLAQQLAPPAVAPAAPPNTFSLGSKIVFGKGTTNVIVTVPAPGVVTATDGSTATASAAALRSVGISAKKKKKKKKSPALVKTTTVTVTAAGAVSVPIKLTKAGKALLKKAGKVKVKIRFTFTPTGGTPNSVVKTFTIKPQKAKKKAKKKKK